MRVAPTLLVASAALLACAPRRPPPDLSLDAGELLAQVRAAQARVASIQGRSRVHVDAPGSRGTIPAFVVAQRPDRLHLEMLDFFGNPVAVLVTAEGRLSFWDAREKVFYRGEATRENLARLVPVPLAPSDLVDVLCGSAPLLPEARAVRADPGRGFVSLVLEAGGRTQTLRVGAGARVERAEVRGAPGPGYDLEFEDVADQGGIAIPMQTSLASRDAGVRVDLRWNDAEPNAATDAALFQLAPPRGARVVEIGAESPAPLVPGGGR